MQNRVATIALLLSMGAGLIGWDVYVAVEERNIEPGKGATISEVTLGFAQRHPIVPFAVGVLCGHLFWPQVRKPEPESITKEPTS